MSTLKKPLTMCTADSEALVKRANELNLTLMVGHILRHHAAFQKVEEMAQAGELGNIRHVILRALI